MSTKKFPKDFIWGAACSAMQLEGGMLEGGKTENIREHGFYDEKTKHYYQDNIPPDVGADFYHRYPEDIKILKELGVDSFRFSIAWARICPDSTDTPNQEGIDYYNKVIDTLIENNITPFFDLYHSDLPQWVLDEGGTVADGFIDHFVNYARICFENFGDRIKFWSTVNEPKLTVYGPYAHAHGAPYICDKELAMKATTNMIIAHFRAVKILKEMWPDAKVGSVHNSGTCYPVSDEEEDILAAKLHLQMQLLFLDPMIRGTFPELVMESELREHITDNMLEQIKNEFVPMDFYGVNYYTPNFIQSEKNEKERGAYVSPYPMDAYGFSNYAPALYELLIFLNDRYKGTPIFVTENGYTYKRDVSNLDVSGELCDSERIEYIKEHVNACADAIRDGVMLAGYYYWSAFDCWEASMGFGYPMGLVAINFDTKERVPRESFYYYKKLISENK